MEQITKCTKPIYQKSLKINNRQIIEQKKKHNVTNNMNTDESNNKHNQPYPFTQEKNVSKIVATQMARKTFIQQRIWDKENKTHTFS